MTCPITPAAIAPMQSTPPSIARQSASAPANVETWSGVAYRPRQKSTSQVRHWKCAQEFGQSFPECGLTACQRAPVSGCREMRICPFYLPRARARAYRSHNTVTGWRVNARARRAGEGENCISAIVSRCGGFRCCMAWGLPPPPPGFAFA